MCLSDDFNLCRYSAAPAFAAQLELIPVTADGHVDPDGKAAHVVDLANALASLVPMLPAGTGTGTGTMTATAAAAAASREAAAGHALSGEGAVCVWGGGATCARRESVSLARRRAALRQNLGQDPGRL